MPRDNAWTGLDRRPQFLATAEVLHGLGVVDELGPVDLGLRLRGPGGPVRAALEPVPTGELATLERPNRPWSAEPVADGRAGYVAYDVTRGDTAPFAAEVTALADRASTELVVLDLRRNGGGDNRTYGPLLAALERAAERSRRLAVLIGRSTFSAAMQLVVDLERRTQGHVRRRADRLQPEPLRRRRARGAPRDRTEGPRRDARLDDRGRAGRSAHAGTDVYVALDSAAFFSGRDPALEAALSTR